MKRTSSALLRVSPGKDWYPWEKALPSLYALRIRKARPTLGLSAYPPRLHMEQVRQVCLQRHLSRRSAKLVVVVACPSELVYFETIKEFVFTRRQDYLADRTEITEIRRKRIKLLQQLDDAPLGVRVRHDSQPKSVILYVLVLESL